MRRREPEPIAEQEREDTARRADQERSDAEYDALLANQPARGWEEYEFPEWTCREPEPDPDEPA